MDFLKTVILQFMIVRLAYGGETHAIILLAHFREGTTPTKIPYFPLLPL